MARLKLFNLVVAWAVLVSGCVTRKFEIVEVKEVKETSRVVAVREHSADGRDILADETLFSQKWVGRLRAEVKRLAAMPGARLVIHEMPAGKAPTIEEIERIYGGARRVLTVPKGRFSKSGQHVDMLVHYYQLIGFYVSAKNPLGKVSHVIWWIR